MALSLNVSGSSPDFAASARRRGASTAAFSGEERRCQSRPHAAAGTRSGHHCCSATCSASSRMILRHVRPATRPARRRSPVSRIELARLLHVQLRRVIPVGSVKHDASLALPTRGSLAAAQHRLTAHSCPPPTSVWRQRLRTLGELLGLTQPLAAAACMLCLRRRASLVHHVLRHHDLRRRVEVGCPYCAITSSASIFCDRARATRPPSSQPAAAAARSPSCRPISEPGPGR